MDNIQSINIGVKHKFVLFLIVLFSHSTKTKRDIVNEPTKNS